jgi:hypothetical protein
MLTTRSHFPAWIVLLSLLGTVARSADPPTSIDASPDRPREISFKTDIRPILSNRCFACHGPDEAKIESGLRLDKLDSATSPADSGATAIVPKRIDQSEMIRRISSEDESVRMPPPHFGGKLSEREITLLRDWIAQGAEYSKHWSFDAIANVAPMPNGNRDDAWQHSPIDLLVKRKLDERGWTPSLRAKPEALLRRLSLDLVGLPPTLAQRQAFLECNDDRAYERLVDEMLASPAFGEHWGRKWLDLARYADSAGYADDPQRTIWGYRDWVIRAINSGMPFDQFTVEQLAGDLLPNPTDDQLVATAFHRNTLTNNEGGTNDEEFRNVALVDRVNTTMAVWMGLTMACAQCHSHKFDPISQKEYFQVLAIFNQTEDADRTDESPVLKWFSPEQRQQRLETQNELDRIQRELTAPDPSLQTEQDAWANPLREPLRWLEIIPTSAKARSKSVIQIREQGQLRVDTITDTDAYSLELPIPTELSLDNLSGIQITSLPDASFPNQGAAIGDGNFVLTGVTASLVETEHASIEGRYVRIDLPGEKKILSLAEVQVFADGVNIARNGKATQSSTDFGGPAEYAIDGQTSGKYTDKSTTHTASSSSPWWEVDLGKVVSVEKIEVWNRTDGLVSDRLAGAKVSILSEDRKTLWESIIETPKASQAMEIKRTLTIPLLAANADYAQEGYPAANAIDKDGKSGWAVGGAVDQSHRLFVALDVPKWKKQLADQPMMGLVGLRLSLKFESTTRRAVLASFSVQLSQDPRTASIAMLPSNVTRAIAKETGSQSDSEKKLLHEFYVSTIASSRSNMRSQRDALTKRLAEIKPTTTVPIMRELSENKRRKTHIQIRGNYKVHGDLVGADVPRAFHPWKPSSSDAAATEGRINRLQFAEWLMQEDNPLTARVIANRYWENFFGVGIVRTSEEFGSQGDLPSNPELLDYLAMKLIRQGWDTKRFIKDLVLSESYRQSSAVTESRYEEDPDNLYASRGPRFRVSAEQIRDMALSVAGLLSHRMFGPPTQPPQPSLGLKAAFGSKTDWDTSKGEDRFRRGIYTLWRRSNPYPSMATFDAPNREVCVLRRDRTNTPLQALVTLNDPAFVEAAQGLARRIVLHELPQGTLEQRIELAIQLALSRDPKPNEILALAQLVHDTRDELERNRDQAEKLATEPLGKLPSGADSIELATWTTLANVILNLDEFLMTP